LRKLNEILAATFGGVRVKPGTQNAGGQVRTMGERNYTVELDRETDGRWIAEIPNLPGVMAYGATEQEAIANAEALAFRVIADQIEKSKMGTSKVSFATA
jgi:predicted RNase H-like HicB family nuclease